LLITNGLLVDPVLGIVEKADLSVKDGRIFSFSPTEARETIDAAGCFVSCGFIESHLHVEGLHLLPEEYGRSFLSHGTTTVVTDLHEIANAGGVPGVQWYLAQAAASPIDLFIMAPSCVPSSRYERGGARIGLRELKKFKSWPQVIGLGEVMDIEGVTERDSEVMGKIGLFAGGPIDGHAPGLIGPALDLYLSAGIHSDHEADGIEEGIEKLEKGVHLFLREGSVARNLSTFLPLIQQKYMPRLSLCADDLSARDLFENGHLDTMLGRLVRSGVSLVDGVRLVTSNPATYFNLSDRNGLALGRKADLVVFGNPERPQVKVTIKNGNVVFRQGESTGPRSSPRQVDQTPLNVSIPPAEKLKMRAKGQEIRVIGVTEGSIVTDDLVRRARIVDGHLASDSGNGLAFAYVFDRYRGSTQFGFGFATGFATKNGAMGSTYAHDSHNLVVVGDNTEDIYEIVRTLRDNGGGMAARHDGRMVTIPMPYFGMITHLDGPGFLQREAELLALVREMGVKLRDPFFHMSFLSLPVIPHLRLTIKGLFHVNTSQYVKANQ
jgi:adenine deaminase